MDKIASICSFASFLFFATSYRLHVPHSECHILPSAATPLRLDNSFAEPSELRPAGSVSLVGGDHALAGCCWAQAGGWVVVWAWKKLREFISWFQSASVLLCSVVAIITVGVAIVIIRTMILTSIFALNVLVAVQRSYLSILEYYNPNCAVMADKTMRNYVQLFRLRCHALRPSCWAAVPSGPLSALFAQSGNAVRVNVYPYRTSHCSSNRRNQRTA
ncbi:hypothetical protein BDU57DRAFT_576801 [Ampelomyces quisqualis]|uniref:Uncharacterized protein n=1 Tax=Ampelomyces quisqualis TaxID=50730 RepID=A0A6A5QML5_AMPQU|nr:hypothetical protein BDU57DRAFT_576801 [Ampelomyces quisqualis]